LASLKFLLRRSRSWTILLVGVVLAAFGVIFGFSSHPYLSAILLSVGTSIVATVLVWWMGPANEQAYEEFLSLGISKAYPSRDKVEPTQWVKWLRAAKRKCLLIGTSHSKWCTDAEFRDALEDRLRNDVNVAIFFLDPTKTAAKVRAKEEAGGRNTLSEITNAIRVLWTIRSELQPAPQSKLKLYVYEATPSMGVTWIDDKFMVVSHILAGSLNVTSPCLLLEPGRYHSEDKGLYETYARNVQSIQHEYSTEITEHNIHNYVPEEQH
jgi:uncharacterized protein DUF5919